MARTKAGASLFGLILLSAISPTAAQPQSTTPDVLTLEPGKAIERELVPGETHAYQVAIEAGQFLRAVVTQRGIDVVVTVTGPAAQKLAEVDSPNGTDGPEPVSLVADVAGTYRIEIRPLDKDAKPGRYDVTIVELLTAAEYAVRLAEERAAADATRRWLAANAIPLTTVEAGHGFVDMQPLQAIVGDARIVALGEATHGTREFFQLKHRMLEFLVTEMGFTIFGIEATMPESFDINEYVLTGKGDPAKGLAGIYFWTWDTEEVLEMIQWMRRYNADPGHTRKVKFYGFDMQSAARAAKVTLAYLRSVDPQRADVADKNLASLASPLTESLFRRMSKETMAAAAESIKAVLSSLDANRNEYVARTGADSWTFARQHAQILAQNIEINAVSFNAGSAVRDRAMAENIRWILDREGPDAKMVVWAHNGHVEAEKQEGNGAMGSHLRRMYGKEMVVFGFAFNKGGFQAVEMPFPSERGLRVFEVPPAPQDSLDAMLASAGLRVAAMNLRAVPKDGPVGKWFSEPRATRSLGAGYGEPFAASFFTKQVTPEIYDALLFVETTTAARPLGKEDGPGLQQRLAAPSNTDFEKGDAGKTPADWQVRPKLRRYDFQIATSDERPYGGARCAVIRRVPGTHYGEVVGRLGQRLDAAGYRGKRIRLRAAARADVSGPGNLSALRLMISGKQVGPEGTIFDSGDKYPVTSRDWRVYEILADVPQDADAIVYGLDLVGDGAAWLDSVTVDLIEP